MNGSMKCSVLLAGCNVAWCAESFARASFLVFFFQAEDGIRDDRETGRQKCALPIISYAVFCLKKKSDKPSISKPSSLNSMKRKQKMTTTHFNANATKAHHRTEPRYKNTKHNSSQNT